MFRNLLVVLVLAAVAVCQEQDYNIEEYLVAKEDLPPGSLVRIRRQVFGGITRFPNGGFNQQAGFRTSLYNTPTRDLSAWGSLSQNFNPRGQSGPINYGGGADFKTATGNGLSFNGLHVPKQGSQGTLAGNLNLLNTPNHQLNGFASHTKTFDPNFKEIGRGSTSGGLGYQHGGGAGLTISGTHTPGAPNSGSVAGNIPLYKSPDTSVNLNGQSSFAQGSKPTHQVGISVDHRF